VKATSVSVRLWIFLFAFKIPNNSVTCRKARPIGRIKGARLLEVLGILLLKLLIGILKGVKRRSRRKTSLLLKVPHAPILLGLIVVEIGHETRSTWRVALPWPRPRPRTPKALVGGSIEGTLYSSSSATSSVAYLGSIPPTLVAGSFPLLALACNLFTF